MNTYGVGFFKLTDELDYDIVVENGDLKPDNGLETMVLISLFTDTRVAEGELPAGETERKGWWADGITSSDIPIGSKLWLVAKDKIHEQAASKIETYTTEALKWMIEQSVVKSVNVSTLINSLKQIQIFIKITRPDNTNDMFSYLWDGQELKTYGV